MPVEVTGSKVEGRKCVSLPLLRKQGEYKDFCRSVDGCGINPPPKGDVLYVHGFLSIFSQTLLELKRVGSPTRRAAR